MKLQDAIKKLDDAKVTYKITVENSAVTTLIVSLSDGNKREYTFYFGKLKYIAWQLWRIVAEWSY